MPTAFLRKLSSANAPPDALTDADKAFLLQICDEVRTVPARRDIVREGDRPDHVQLVLEGWACRYTVLPDGGRQIMAFLVPGDFCDIHVTLLDRMDHSIASLTETRIAQLPHDRIDDLLSRPSITRALWWAGLVDQAVLRSWIVNLGRRDAFDRIGHLICELRARLRNVGMVEDDRFDLPLTQEELGDALGLTPVHVNRTLRRMREADLLVFHRQQVEILDITRLQDMVGFDPNYLHLPRRNAL